MGIFAYKKVHMIPMPIVIRHRDSCATAKTRCRNTATVYHHQWWMGYSAVRIWCNPTSTPMRLLYHIQQKKQVFVFYFCSFFCFGDSVYLMICNNRMIGTQRISKRNNSENRRDKVQIFNRRIVIWPKNLAFVRQKRISCCIYGANMVEYKHNLI